MTNKIENTTFKPAFNKVLEEVKTNHVKLQKVTNHGFRMQAIGAPVAIGGALIAGTIAAIAVAILFAPVAAPLLAIIGTVGVASFGAVAASVAILATLVAVGLLIGGHFVKKNEQAQADKIAKLPESRIQKADAARADSIARADEKKIPEEKLIEVAVAIYNERQQAQMDLMNNQNPALNSQLEAELTSAQEDYNVLFAEFSKELEEKVAAAIAEQAQSV